MRWRRFRRMHCGNPTRTCSTDGFSGVRSGVPVVSARLDPELLSDFRDEGLHGRGTSAPEVGHGENRKARRTGPFRLAPVNHALPLDSHVPRLAAGMLVRPNTSKDPHGAKLDLAAKFVDLVRRLPSRFASSTRAFTRHRQNKVVTVLPRRALAVHAPSPFMRAWKAGRCFLCASSMRSR